MRVCIIPTSYLLGNSGSMVYSRAQAESLASQGVDVHIIVSEPIELLGVNVHVAPITLPHPVEEDWSKTPQDYYDSIHAIVSTLLSLHEKHSFDLIHGFYATFTGYAACLFQALTNIPAVVSSFGRDINKGMTMSHPIGKWLATGCLPQAKLIIASNEPTKEMVLTYPNVNPDNIVILGMGVDESLFKSGRYTQAEARKILGWSNEEQIVTAILSCMLPEKRTELIVNAMLPILQERTDTRLALVGSDYDATPNGAFPRIRAMIQPEKLLTQITFAGPQPHLRIPLYLAASNIVVDARNVYNFSSALMEALAMGRPVIVSKFSERQIATNDNDKHYCVFNEDHANGLRAELTNLLGNQQLQSDLSIAANKWWGNNREYFSLAGQTKKLIQLYESVIENQI